MEHKPELRLYANLNTKLEPELYLGQESFHNRRLFTMLRCGTNSLRIETGRWKKEPLEKRVCDKSGSRSALSVGLWCMTRLGKVWTMTSFEQLDTNSMSDL